MADTRRPSPRGGRRIGDDTRARIDELADGWRVEPAPGGAEPKDAPGDSGGPAGRAAAPPPAAAGTAPGRANRASGAPPPPPPPAPSGRANRASGPPPPPRAPSGRANGASGAPPPAPGGAPAGRREPEAGRIDTRAPTAVGGDALASGRADSRAATAVAPPRSDTEADATVAHIDLPGSVAPPRSRSGQRARDVAQLPRERGPFGDVRYVFSALFGVARARRELARIDAQLAAERAARNERLIAVARHAIADADAEFDAVARARDALAAIEERRSRHAGAVAAADERIAAIERERDAERSAFAERDAQFDTELRAIDAKLAPLERRAGDVRKQVAAVRAAVDDLAARIAREERRLHAVDRREDPSAIEARLASLRAERDAVAAEEPALAAELDDLEPRIAKLAGEREAVDRRRAEARDAEDRAAARAADAIAAERARQKVERAAMDDCDRERDDALLALGETIDVDRPPGYAPRLAGADEHAVTIATLERRQIELQEIVSGIDRAALARGVLWMALAAAAAAVPIWLALR